MVCKWIHNARNEHWINTNHFAPGLRATVSVNTMLIGYDINTCQEQDNSDFSKIVFMSLDRNIFIYFVIYYNGYIGPFFAKNVLVLF